MASIADLIAAGKDAGIFQFYLPFILMFAVIYGLLTKVKIFGDNKTINLVIALAASASLMMWAPIGTPLMEFISGLFGQTLVVVLSLISLAIVLVMIGSLTTKEGEKFDLSKYATWFFVGALVIGIGVFFSSGGAKFFPGLPELGINLPQFLSSQSLAVIIVVILTGVVIFFLTKATKP